MNKLSTTPTNRTSRSMRRAGVIFAALAAASPALALAEVRYDILDLGTLGGIESRAFDINNNGQIVGRSRIASGAERAFRTAANSPINSSTDDLGTLSNGNRSRGYSINASGNVVGDSNTLALGSLRDRAFRTAANSPINSATDNLGTLGGDWSFAFGVNNSNQVTGGSSVTTGLSAKTHAFLHSGGQMKDLGTLVGSIGNSWGQAINTNGYVAGYSQANITNYWEEHAFLWSPTTNNATTGTLSDLGTLGGTYSYAWSINDSNQVVGQSTLPGDALTRAFRYSNGTMIDLGSLGGTKSEANDINNVGEIVGTSRDAGETMRPFVFANGIMSNLNELIPAGTGWVLQSARAVNDSGQIVGWGLNPSGQLRGFLLTPLARPSMWNVNAGGNWSAAGNWLNGVPNGIDKAANFASVIDAPRTINVDTAVTVGSISFDNPNTYALAGSNPITMETSNGEASIGVVVGSHVISAPLILNDSTVVNILPPAGVSTISSSISSASAASHLIKAGGGTLVLSGCNSYAGSTVLRGGTLAIASTANLGSNTNGIVLSGGRLRTDAAINSAARNVTLESNGGEIDTNGFDSSVGAIEGGGSFVKSGAGNLSAPHVRAAAVDVAAGRLTVTGASTSIAGTLTLAGQLDLRDNNLIVTGESAGTWTGSGYDGVTGMVQSGRNGGSWDGSGIITTEPLALSQVTTLAVATAAQTGKSSFAGVSVSPVDVLVMYTLAGDANLSGFVDADDYFQIDAKHSSTNDSDRNFFNGDFNYDGLINGDDYAMIDAAFSAQGALATGAFASVSAVPEPAGFAAPAMSIALLHRRRRKQTATFAEPLREQFSPPEASIS